VDRHLCAYGPITRSVDDLALVAGVLAGPDGIDTEVAPVPWRRVPPAALGGLRVVWRRSWPGVPTSRLVAAAVGKVASSLADAGAILEEGDPGVTREEVMGVWQDYLPQVSAAILDLTGLTMPATAPDAVPQSLSAWIKVLRRRDALQRAVDATLTRRYDAFLCPAAIASAFPHSPSGSPIPVDGATVDSQFVTHYLYPFNLLGNPAVVLPAGVGEDGLPIGVQLVGARFRDEELLACAKAIDDVVRGYACPPGWREAL
jgi:amidase